jgi:hypothetical protein
MTSAAKEFGLDREVLNKRAMQADIVPGDDGKYSIRQMASAAYGDLERERIREVAARADQLERENALAQRKLIPAEEVQRKMSLFGMAFVGIVESSKLSDEEKDLLRTSAADLVK